MCKYILLLVLFPVCFAQAASDFAEIPLVPDVQRPVGWLYNANDGFGHNFGTDEDNLRTYGISTGYSTGRHFLFTLDYYSFTDRNTTYDNSKRIDEIKSLAGINFLQIHNPAISISVYAGPGTMFYGNFGGLSVQENAHGPDTVHTRPVPHTYDKSSQAALGFVYSEVYMPHLSLNITGYAHITSAADYCANVSLGYWIVKPMLQSLFSVSYHKNGVHRSGVVAENIYDRENGFWIANKTMIGPVVIERSFDANTLNQASYIGFRFGDHSSSSDLGPQYRFSYSIGVPIGHNSWIEYFRVNPFTDAQRVALFLRTYHTENTIDNNETKLRNDRQIRRIIETSVGSELHFNDPNVYSLLDGFIFGGCGFSREMLTTYNQLEANFLELKTTPIIHGGCGIRLMIPDLIFHNPSRYVGAEIQANVRYGAQSSGIYTNPDLLLNWGLVFSER